MSSTRATLIRPYAGFYSLGSKVKGTDACASQSGDEEHFNKCPCRMKDPSVSAGVCQGFKVFFPPPPASSLSGLPLMLFSQPLSTWNKLHAKRYSFNKLYRVGKKEREGERKGRWEVYITASRLHGSTPVICSYKRTRLGLEQWGGGGVGSLLNKMCKHTLALFNKEHHYLSQNICWHCHG